MEKLMEKLIEFCLDGICAPASSDNEDNNVRSSFFQTNGLPAHETSDGINTKDESSTDTSLMASSLTATVAQSKTTKNDLTAHEMSDRTNTKDEPSTNTSLMASPFTATVAQSKTTKGALLLHLPSEMLVSITSYVTLEDIIKLHTTNRQLLSQRDGVILSVLKEMEREDAFKVFSKLVICGNVNAMKWFQQDPRFQDPSDTENDGNNDSNDDSALPFLKRTLNKRNHFGDKMGAALHVAAWYGHRPLVEELLTIGAPVKAKGVFGRTALHWAAWKGRKDIIVILLEHGADLEAKQNNGRTALIRAAMEGQTDVVVTLLERGADIRAKSKYGDTALDLASKRRHTETKRVLLNHGSR